MIMDCLSICLYCLQLPLSMPHSFQRIYILSLELNLFLDVFFFDAIGKEIVFLFPLSDSLLV